MTAPLLPPSTDITGSTVTQGEGKTAITKVFDFLDYIRDYGSDASSPKAGPGNTVDFAVKQLSATTAHFAGTLTATTAAFFGPSGTPSRANAIHQVQASTNMFICTGAMTDAPFSGWIQTADPGSGVYPLALNPNGGQIFINKLIDDGTGAVLQVAGGISATTAHFVGGNATGFSVDNGGQQYTKIDIQNAGITKASVYWDNVNNELVYSSPNGPHCLLGGNIIVPGIYSDTTASASNVFVDTDGTLKRSTSSERYKTAIEPLADEYADKLLDAVPIWYRSLCAGDNPDWSYYGFSAEKMAEIDPRYVFWTPQYKNGVEETETQIQATEPVTVKSTEIVIENSKAIQKIISKKVEQPVFDIMPVFDENGQPVIVEVSSAKAAVFDEVGNEIEHAQEAVFTQMTHAAPHMITKIVKTDKQVIDESLPMIPDGVQYERIVVGHHSIIQRLITENAELKQVLTALTNRLETLEAK